MKIRTSDAATMLNAAKDQYDGGTIRYYTGAIPASVAAGVSGTLLATMTFSATAFPTTASNTLTASAVTQDASADATGTIGYAACFESDGTSLISLHTVGTSGAEVTVNTTSCVAGLPVTMTSFTITQPLG
jgi:hypothetical protein